ncbi:MAG: SgcJ/EcaC family oxidoreductase [Caldimonas sp.]
MEAHTGPDEQAIRDVISKWHRATIDGDIDSVLELVAEDVVFLVAGQPPMTGRSAFERGLRSLLETHHIESTHDVREVSVAGDMAWAWTELTVRIVSTPGGEVAARTGHALSILHRQDDGRWLVFRDANLLGPATP